MNAFRNHAWDEAAEKFRLAIANSDHEFYLKLCDEYKMTPPPETWDGVITLDEK